MHALLHPVTPTPQQATTDPRLHRRLLDTHRQVWVSLLWGHHSFLLGPGVHKVLFVPSKSLFLQSCVSSAGSTAGLMVTSSRRAYATRGLLYPEPLPLQQPLLTRTPSGDTQIQFCLNLCGVSGSDMYHNFFIHSSAHEHLGCFHVLAIVNGAAVDTGIHVSLNSGFLGVYAQQWDCWVIRQFESQFLKESQHCSP